MSTLKILEQRIPGFRLYQNTCWSVTIALTGKMLVS